MRAHLLATALLLAMPATAQQPLPAAPVPPSTAKYKIQHTTRWLCTIPTEQGVKEAYCYIVTRTQDTPGRRADINGDTVVDGNDMIEMMQSWGWEEPSE